MTSEKLGRMLQAKACHHGAKAAAYQKQAASFSATIGESGQSNDPTSSLRDSQRRHENKATFFDLLVENLILDEIYRLSEQDCVRLELYSQYF